MRLESGGRRRFMVARLIGVTVGSTITISWLEELDLRSHGAYRHFKVDHTAFVHEHPLDDSLGSSRLQMERARQARRLRAEILNDRLENLNHRSATRRDELTRMQLEAPIAVKHSKRSREAAAMLLYVDAQFSSPYVIAAYVSLLEKGLTFDVHPLDLFARANQQPEFASTSITRRVPTLIHDDFSLSESSAICEYIDETFPGTRLYPTDLRDRARARQVQAWVRSDLMPIREERPTFVVFCGAKRPALSAQAIEATQKLFAVALQLLDGRTDHLFDQWSIADVDLAMMLQRLVAHGDSVPRRLVEYANKQWLRPSVQQWINHARPPLTEY